MLEKVIAVDPGPKESAFVLWDGAQILAAQDMPNEELLTWIRHSVCAENHLAIELIRGFGIMASDGLFDTCIWTGRFLQAFGAAKTTLIGRKEVSKYVCGNAGVSHDKFVREALITRFGQPGTKKEPGTLYGIAGHKWAALALAVTWWDTKRRGTNGIA